jgi:hypothetical protein
MSITQTDTVDHTNGHDTSLNKKNKGSVYHYI